jgi:HEAT repeat protein
MRRNQFFFVVLGFIAAAAPSFAQDKQDPSKPAQAKPAQAKPEKIESITDRKIDDLVTDLVSGDDASREVAVNELPRRGKAAVPPLVACLKAADRSTDARVAAAHVLRKLLVPSGKEPVDADAESAIAAVFQDTKAPLPVRGEAALALGDLKCMGEIPVLIEGLNDRMFKVSENAREALVRLGQGAVDPVIAAYQKEIAAQKTGKDGIIYRSILICGDLGGDKARAFLSDAIKVKAGPRAVAIRAHAARALGLSGERKSIQPLIDAYQDEREFDVAQAIMRSLEWLTDQHEIPPQPLRWKAWWEAHRDELLGNEDHKYDAILLPKNGLKKGDPIQAPGLESPTAPPQDAPK